MCGIMVYCTARSNNVYNNATNFWPSGLFQSVIDEILGPEHRFEISPLFLLTGMRTGLSQNGRG
jgi:hypothetical protein